MAKTDVSSTSRHLSKYAGNIIAFSNVIKNRIRASFKRTRSCSQEEPAG